MTLSPRAANQFQAIVPDHVVAIVNALRERSFKPGATIVQVPDGARCGGVSSPGTRTASLSCCLFCRTASQGSWNQTKAMEGDSDDDRARTITTAEMHRDEQAVR